MKNFLKGFGIVLIALVPWTWMFTYHLWIAKWVGDTLGQLSIFCVGGAVLAIGIYATVKGYGRQKPSGDAAQKTEDKSKTA